MGRVDAGGVQPHSGELARPSLLVSLHDVSPLTLDASRRMVDLAVSNGVSVQSLTVLVIARHEDRAPLDEHPAACAWLRELAAAGACLCLHGLTHRMTEVVRGPWAWAWARGFARGQGEFFLCDEEQSLRKLLAASTIVERAGLGPHVHGFVPPAWLLSPAARKVVARFGFAFHERLAGIVVGETYLAQRLIGFGSLSSIEAAVTTAVARVQAQRRPTDTRLAIHPADLNRPTTVAAISRVIGKLVPMLTPMNYTSFLNSRQAVVLDPSAAMPLRVLGATACKSAGPDLTAP